MPHPAVDANTFHDVRSDARPSSAKAPQPTVKASRPQSTLLGFSPFFLIGALLCAMGVTFVTLGMYYGYTTKDQPTEELKQKHAQKAEIFNILTGLAFLMGSLMLGGAYLSCSSALYKLKYLTTPPKP